MIKFIALTAIFSVPLLFGAIPQEKQGAEKIGPGPEQWEATIREFERADRASPPPQGGVLFLGGSNMRHWTNLAAYFPDLVVINRGFGGAKLSDIIHYSDRIVLPYRPRAIIVNAAANDLKNGSPEDARDACRTLVTRVRAALPQVTLYQVSIPPFLSAVKVPERMERFRKTNRMLEELAHEMDGLEFVDLSPHFLAADGQPRGELFVDGGTHFSAKGYEVVAAALRGKL